MAKPRTGSLVRLFASDARGAALVEFGIVLPLMLLLFGMIVEGSRMLWGFQSAITAVRDETRYVARVVPADICDGGTLPISVSDANLLTRVSQKTYVVTVNSVSLATCSGGGAPIAEVTANITIEFPLKNLFLLVGSTITELTTDVTDSSRIYGT